MTQATHDAGSQLVAGVLHPDEMDPSVRPADDLFRAVNGRWLDSAQIPADRPATGSFIALVEQAELACRELVEEAARAVEQGQAPAGSEQEKIGLLYSSFMDEAAIEAAGMEPLSPELTDIYAATTKEELARVLGRHSTVLAAPIDAGVEVDLNDPDRYSTWVGQSGLGLPDESYYSEADKAALRQGYTAHVSTMLTLAGVAGSEQLGSRSADELAAAIMAVETALAAGHWDRVTTRDIEKSNNPMSWAEMVALAPDFPWEEWKAGYADAAAAAGVPMGSFLEDVIVGQPDYLPLAATVWRKSALEDLRAWAVWHLIHSRAPMLTSPLVEENFAFYSHTLAGIEQLRPRWKRGVGVVEGCLGEALGQLYVAKHFPPSHKQAMEQLVADLTEAYRQSIESLPWMSPATRTAALEKLSQFTPKIGYPDTWRDYSSLEIVPGDLMESIRHAELFGIARALTKLAGPVDREEWHMTPQTVNAYYNPTMNEIVFPAAILQPPFFDPAADAAINYAGIGGVIGHEIGHGFDDQGSTFDGTGKVRDWWTQEDRAAFKERTQALIAQYDAYTPAKVLARALEEGTPEAEIPHVNGALTIGENIGDLGGLTIALKAYRLALAREGISSPAEAPVIDGLTAMERFFYSWARIWKSTCTYDYALLLLNIDPHSPAEFRCNGIVRNLDEFYETFSVTPEDALWLDPEQRVSIW